ncbi:transposase family protein, partial [Micromonospora sp. NPDC023633]|uniref:helix-turn-helix domain-containing protein n=1 Tax=Micromonospora sp. NPDC023633 TaxID=3154320 RepID=UPI0034047621
MAGSPRERVVAASALARSTGSGSPGRLLATLVHLRHGLTHDVVAAWFGVHRSTVTCSVAEVRPLLAERGCRVHDGVRLRTLADVVTYLGHDPRAAAPPRARSRPSCQGRRCPAQLLGGGVVVEALGQPV